MKNIGGLAMLLIILFAGGVLDVILRIIPFPVLIALVAVYLIGNFVYRRTIKSVSPKPPRAAKPSEELPKQQASVVSTSSSKSNDSLAKQIGLDG